MTTFEVRYKKGFFWKKVKVTGFGLNTELDRMVFHFEDSSIIEIAEWSKYDCKLGKDYHDFLRNKMEKDAGQAVK